VDNLLTMVEVCKILKVSRNYIYIMLKNGKFPAPIIISKRKHRWLPSDIENWINEKHNNRF
jgi:excisionase family DNA binding protein